MKRYVPIEQAMMKHELPPRHLWLTCEQYALPFESRVKALAGLIDVELVLGKAVRLDDQAVEHAILGFRRCGIFYQVSLLCICVDRHRKSDCLFMVARF